MSLVPGAAGSPSEFDNGLQLGGGSDTLNNYEEGSTASITPSGPFAGATTPATITVDCTRVGNAVTVNVQGFFGTFSGVAGDITLATAIPASCRPTNENSFVVIVQENSAFAVGRARVATNGDVILSASVSGTGFSAGAIGLRDSPVETAFSYLIT